MKFVTTQIVLFSSLLLASAASAQNTPVPVTQCSPQEASEIASRSERATLEKVRQDLRVEGRIQAMALGSDERDCLERARYAVQNQAARAIEQCSHRATYFRSCEVVENRVSHPPTLLQPTVGWGTIDDYKTDETRCRLDAQHRAQQEALAGCQRSFNRNCRITLVNNADHRIERRRRYGIAGPKEDYHICSATAQALPDTHERFQCGMEVIAKVIIR